MLCQQTWGAMHVKYMDGLEIATLSNSRFADSLCSSSFWQTNTPQEIVNLHTCGVCGYVPGWMCRNTCVLDTSSTAEWSQFWSLWRIRTCVSMNRSPLHGRARYRRISLDMSLHSELIQFSSGDFSGGLISWLVCIFGMCVPKPDAHEDLRVFYLVIDLNCSNIAALGHAWSKKHMCTGLSERIPSGPWKLICERMFFGQTNSGPRLHAWCVTNRLFGCGNNFETSLFVQYQQLNTYWGTLLGSKFSRTILLIDQRGGLCKWGLKMSSKNAIWDGSTGRRANCLWNRFSCHFLVIRWNACTSGCSSQPDTRHF